MRTIHVLRPWSFRMIFLSFSLPLGALGLALAAVGGVHAGALWACFGITAVIRLALHCVYRDRRPFSDLWLLPLRDGLLCWVWFSSFFTSRITWRGAEFHVDGDGFLRKPT
jgi:ceramide glucosyltransferase